MIDLLLDPDAEYVGGTLIAHDFTGNPTGGPLQVGSPSGGFIGEVGDQFVADDVADAQEVLEQVEEVSELIERLKEDETEEEVEAEEEAKAEAAAEEMALWPLAAAGVLLVLGAGVAVVAVGGLAVASQSMK